MNDKLKRFWRSRTLLTPVDIAYASGTFGGFMWTELPHRWPVFVVFGVLSFTLYCIARTRLERLQGAESSEPSSETSTPLEKACNPSENSGAIKRILKQENRRATTSISEKEDGD